MTIDPLLLAFEQFKRQRAAALGRIAKATRGTHDAQDMESEAWFTARKIGEKRGYRVDLFDPIEQEIVLGWLYKRFVTFVNGKRKESIDQEPTGDESGTWRECLAAPEETNPLTQLLQLDEDAAQALPMKGFSEFSAYMILLKRCEMRPAKLADYLAVSFQTLCAKIQRAQDWAAHQPSLFDGLENVDRAFVSRADWIKRLWMGWQERKTKGSTPVGTHHAAASRLVLKLTRFITNAVQLHFSWERTPVRYSSLLLQPLVDAIDRALDRR